MGVDMKHDGERDETPSQILIPSKKMEDSEFITRLEKSIGRVNGVEFKRGKAAEI